MIFTMNKEIIKLQQRQQKDFDRPTEFPTGGQKSTVLYCELAP